MVLTKAFETDASPEASEPSLEISFFLSNNQIQRITLSQSDQFLFQVIGGTPDLKEKISRWMDAYLAKKEPPFLLPLDLSALTPFTQKGLEAIAAIPLGETASYKEIASRSGNALAIRAIGGVCNRNPFPLLIPCHRVIAADGTLGGFAYPLELKQNLLDFEKISS